jgi:hypothetical protein
VIREPGAPGAPPPQHRLHNCGPSAREVFRTSPVGTVVTLDLVAALCGWSGGGDAVAGFLVGPYEAPPGLIESAAAWALGELAPAAAVDAVTVESTTAARARRHLAHLVRHVVATGLVSDLVGIARDLPRDPAMPYPTAPSVTQPEHLARVLAAHAVYAPPLLLWNRPPSLHWCRSDHVLELRRFPSATGGAR